ncbi:MAG: hypothetical protein K5790_06685 [Nitrosopumilus sp.]|uniref:hypothetical protein n=1 Tax=Nitrosopumilus sp. TaxID=2024843 RepID=UPI00247C5A0B|nr:hypothetical protein [Nitrosopumilus sp.]MCV0392964.1 hypothetical protein [Nitrosopumilus sp.]
MQISSVYAAEDLPIITIDFISGNVIDLDKGSTMIRANIQIENYDPQDGYHFMQIIRLSDGKIIKDTEILPKVIEDDLFGVQILHYLDPDQNEEEILGDYGFRIYSEYGSSETVSTFSIIKSSMPLTVTQNTIEELEIPEEIVESNTIEELEIPEEPESKIPSWVHDVFIWYADKTITENELLTALEYLISQGILDVNSD